MAQFKTYAWLLLISILAPVLLVGGFNLFALRQPRNPDRFAEASAWQEKTHGITMVLLQRSDNGPFKALRLNDRLRDINAVVFGASTSMAIRDDMFPAGVRIYNFSQPGNPLSSTIGQAQYVLDHDDGIKWMFVPLDWAVGFLYFPADPPQTDLSPAHVLQVVNASDKPLPWGSAIREAFSYPVIRNQYETLRRVFTSNDKSFRSMFLSRVSDDYHCDGNLAKDYEPDGRGNCFGFRYDGSLNYVLPPNNPRAILETSLKANSFVRSVLPMTKGQPRQLFLDRLAEQARRLEQRGGRMIFFMPPLFPELEAMVLKQPDVGDYLRHTKSAIAQWAEQNKLVVFDFGPSEKFGCVASEFGDGVHGAWPCYRKAFDAAWRAHPGLF